ncbi:MAG: TetM/TetW/TetO/TetS family tetracycline resistance ribosomal protection protein [Clostridia bacterium]|nr:TetM/TetW/TetO/TetS family tetracycline resistance ribosomal protection protein [Clostridia bacterium]
MKHMRNIGVFAHVDAGKTTLSEQLLMHSGAIRRAGSVDEGTAHTDNLPVEQRRGISVKATCVSLTWRDVTINLIDTPGHVDFSAEVERSLWALDAAVVVVCAVEGVQPHTETLFHALKEQDIPTLFFLNKTDREGADVNRVLAQIRRLLTAEAVPMSDEDAVTEFVCAQDDELLEQYLSGEDIAPDFIRARLADLTRAAKAHPVYAGSALRDEGVIPLLDAMVDFLPSPKTAHTPESGSKTLPGPASTGDGLCGVVFASTQDRVLGRGVWVRLYAGSLENRAPVILPAGVDPLTGEEKLVQRKITQIRRVDGSDAGSLTAGEIGVIYGLGDVKVGQVLGEESLLPRRVEPGHLRTPLITVQVIPENPEDMQSLRAACEALSAEDPLLQVRYSKALNELQLHVMGTIQLEIIQELLDTRFGMKVSFSKPAVIYKETIAQAASGFVAYTMPKPCWAIMRFEIEPAPRGSGVTFRSTVPVKDILLRYQHQVEQALPLALHQGRLGWEVTDINITLVDGNHHQFHTHPLDFIVATPWGIQDGLKHGGSTLLEPILETRFLLPPDCVGRVMSDVALMRGEVTHTETDEDRVLMTALIPVATSVDYAATLASATSGRGSMSVRLHGYRDCPLELGATSPRRSVDPLDTSKYILAARSALEGGIFDLE